MKEFSLNKKFVVFVKVCPILCLGLTVFAISALFMKDESGNYPTLGELALFAGMALMFGVISYVSYTEAKRLPVDITMDDDGLWYSHLSREEALVSWKIINEIRESPILGRLTLANTDGEELIEIQYQLSDFELLRSVLQAKTAWNEFVTELPVTYKWKLQYHLRYVCLPIAFMGFAWYLARDDNALAMYALFSIPAAGLLYEYATSVSALTIREEKLIVRYLLKERVISCDDIELIELVDTFHSGHRGTEVRLTSARSKKPIKFRGLGNGGTELYAVLSRTYNR